MNEKKPIDAHDLLEDLKNSDKENYNKILENLSARAEKLKKTWRKKYKFKKKSYMNLIQKEG